MASLEDSSHNRNFRYEEEKSFGSGSAGDQQVSSGDVELKEGGIDSDDDPQMAVAQAKKKQSFWS